MQADSLFVLVLLAAFFGFVAVVAVRSRRQAATAANPQPNDTADASRS